MAIKTPESLVISARITMPLAQAIEKFLPLNTYVTPSDFIRDAIREKLRREASWLLDEMTAPRKSEVEINPIQGVETDLIQDVRKDVEKP